MTVLFLTQYGRQAASSRTRVFQYLPFLSGRGVDYRVMTVLPDRGIAGSQILVTRNSGRKLLYYLWASWRTLSCGLKAWWLAPGYDLLFIQKVVLPAPARWLFRLRHPPLLFDFDDAIFTSEVQRGNWLAGWKQRRNASGVPAMLRLASRAVVENEYTGGYAAGFCPVTTITGPIDTESHRPAPFPRPTSQVVLGWIGSATTLAYLDVIRQPLRRLANRYPGLLLRVVGAPEVSVEGVRVQAKPWHLEEEVADLQGFDIGVMPIPDDPWTRGKGGYKLLQYMAVGLPVVTSPVGINQRLVRDGHNGYWARDGAEWEERLARLVEDPALRAAMGRRGRQIVEDEYSLARSSQRLVEAMEQAARGAQS